MKRRDFMCSFAGGAFAIGALARCEWDPRGGETLFDLLVSRGYRLEGRFRVVDGETKFYVTSVNGRGEDLPNDRYWIFFINDVPVGASVNEVIVPVGSRVSMRLMRPPEV